MFIKILYKVLKILVCLYITIASVAFIYTIQHSQTADSIIVGVIFIIGSLVGLYLIKYYANTIISFKIDSEDIILINAKQIQIRIKKDKCVKIIHKPSKVIMEFSNGKKYYIHKYYFFNKEFFDFSELNSDNFKFASIIST